MLIYLSFDGEAILRGQKLSTGFYAVKYVRTGKKASAHLQVGKKWWNARLKSRPKDSQRAKDRFPSIPLQRGRPGEKETDLVAILLICQAVMMLKSQVLSSFLQQARSALTPASFGEALQQGIDQPGNILSNFGKPRPAPPFVEA